MRLARLIEIRLAGRYSVSPGMLAGKQRCWKAGRYSGRQADIPSWKQRCWEASRDAGRQVVIQAGRRENVQVGIKIFRQANVGQAVRYSGCRQTVR